MIDSEPHRPPNTADRFLEWFCPDTFLEEIQGDLFELYEERLSAHGRLRANLWYWWSVCWFLRPYLLRHTRRAVNLAPIMWKNYATVALRQLRRQPLYSTINVTGLALGIAACVLMLLLVREELSYDALHEDADRIVRVLERRTSEQGGVAYFANTSGLVGPTLVSDLPEVVDAVRMLDRSSVGRFTMRYGQNERHEGDYFITEPSFFRVFDFPLLVGDPETVLSAPRQAVLTESAARFYFGAENPVGKSIETTTGNDYLITGLMADPPGNSHLQFNMLLSLATQEAIQGWRDYIADWESTGFMTYVLMTEPAAAPAVAGKLPGFTVSHRSPELAAARALEVQSLSDVHFGSAHVVSEHNAGKSAMSRVYIFVGIAVLIALIACINYMNLATAWALKRAKEVGMRKVVGARRSQLVGQFLGESVMTALFALVLAMGLALLALPVVNGFTGKSLSLHPSSAWPVLLGVLLTTVVVGLISGSYPALFTARFDPMQVFRGRSGKGGEGRLLRNALVVAQFAASIVLVATTLATARQFDFIQSKDLGFEPEGLVVVDINSGQARRGFEGMKEAFGQVAGVRGVSVSSRVPGDWKPVPLVAIAAAGAGAGQRLEATFMGVDADFLDTYDMRLASGRNFSEELGTDSTALVINRTAADLLGIVEASEQPLDITGVSFGGQWTERGYSGRVVGIVEDFHFQSLHETIGPAVLGFRNNPVQSIDYFTLRVSTTDLSGLMAQVEGVQEAFDPETPLEANFLDMRMADAYVQDRRAGAVFSAATALALLIACFGLFGLAAFVAEQRTKEIGIRKALGASTWGVVLMISGAFTRLVLVAFLIAGPTAYWLTNRLLDNFAYRVSVGMGTLLAAGLAALVLASVAVSIQSWRAARTEPVRVLRYE